MGVGMGIANKTPAAVPEVAQATKEEPKDETDHVRLTVVIENKMVDGKKRRMMTVEKDDYTIAGRPMKHEFTDKEAMKAYIDKCIGK